MNELMKELAEKYAEQSETLKKLNRSMAIQRFMPDAFEHGSVRLGGRATVTPRTKGS